MISSFPSLPGWPGAASSVLALENLAGRLEQHADVVDGSVLVVTAQANATTWESEAGRAARAALDEATGRMRADATAIRELVMALRQHVRAVRAELERASAEQATMHVVGGRRG